MTKTKSLLFLFVLLIGLLAFAGCSDDSDETNNPGTDTDNPGGGDDDEVAGGEEEDGVVDDGLCAEDSECPDGESCHDVLGICVEAECPEGTDTECETLYPYGDAANVSNYMYACASDSLCYPLACTVDADCAAAGIICVEGTCTKAGVPDDIAKLEINQGNGMLTEGGDLQLTATAYHQSGAILQFDPASLSTMYTWSISEGDAASVAADANTAGAAILSGTATGKVKVKVAAGNASAEVSYQVFGAVTTGDVRVVLYDDKTGELIGDAKVYVGQEEMTGDAGWNGCLYQDRRLLRWL